MEGSPARGICPHCTRARLGMAAAGAYKDQRLASQDGQHSQPSC